MGCWNNILLNGSRMTADSEKEHPLLLSLPALCPSRQSAPISTLLNYSKPCIYRAIASRPGSITLLLKEPDYSSFRLFQSLLSRSLPPGPPLLALPAGSGTFMLSFYSAEPNRVHNVEPGSSRLCLEELDLSNTLETRKTLSLSKPPHRFLYFVTFLTVLDGIRLPGKGREGTFQGSVGPGSALFLTVPSEEAFLGPKEARFLSNRASLALVLHGRIRLFLSKPGPQGLCSQDPGTFPSKAQEAQDGNRMGMKTTIPLREKSWQKPMIPGSGTGSEGPRGPSERCLSFRPVPAQAPTPGPLN